MSGPGHTETHATPTVLLFLTARRDGVTGEANFLSAVKTPRTLARTEPERIPPGGRQWRGPRMHGGVEVAQMEPPIPALVAKKIGKSFRERPQPAWRHAFTVLAMSMAMVMGPTPPGTGVMARHLGATASKSTSPTIL